MRFVRSSHVIGMIVMVGALVLVGLLAGDSFAANLLNDPGFENGVVPNCLAANFADTWSVLSQTPDVISFNCVSKPGADPTTQFFPSLGAANGGLRLTAAAWWPPNLTERFGQTLGTPLTPGQSYTLSGYFVLGENAAYSPIKFDVYLTNSYASGDSLVGSIGDNSVIGTWTYDSLTFVAPSNSAILYFSPESRTGTGFIGYMGVDDLDLQLNATVPTEAKTFGAIKALFENE